MAHCNIVLLNNDAAICYAGQVLKGNVVMYLEQPMKLRGLILKVNGAATCHWKELETKDVGTGDNRRTIQQEVFFHGKQIFMDLNSYLFGGPGAAANELPGGTHRYEFEFQLPSILPSSFETTYGNVRYNLEAVMDVPFNFDGQQKRMEFTVLRQDDLNDFPDLRVPSENEEVTTFCCFCCESDELLMTVTIPQSGYIPSQNIPIVVNYVNKSDVVVERTRICFEREICYKCDSPHSKERSETEKIIEIYTEGVGKTTTAKIEKNLLLPTTMLKTLKDYCNIIQITYELKVEADVEGCHINIRMNFPITIGSVPIGGGVATIPSPINDSHFNSPLPNNNNVSIASAPFEDDLPPSFDEAVKFSNGKTEATSKDSASLNFGWNIPNAQRSEK